MPPLKTRLKSKFVDHSNERLSLSTHALHSHILSSFIYEVQDLISYVNVCVYKCLWAGLY